MSTFDFTPSAGPRLVRCLGSAVLPQVSESYESAERGTALHGFLRSLALGKPRAEALALVPEDWREDAGRIATPEDIAAGRPEVGFALDLHAETATALGEDMTREQVRERKPPGTIGMLLDWVTLEGPGVVVRDWKVGWQEDLGPASEHLQLRTYGAAAILAWGAPWVRCELRHWDGVRWWVDSTTLDWLGALEVLEEVRALVGRAEKARAAHAESGAMPRLSVGRWCSWCPSQRFCPALTGGLLAVARGEYPTAPVVELSPEQAGQAFEFVRQLRERLNGLEKDLMKLATSSPLPLSDGKVLRAQEVQRTSVDPEAAAAWLAQRYGEEVPRAATTVKASMSWEALGDALRTHVLPGLLQAHKEKRLAGRKPTLAGLIAEARSGLEATGAVKVSTHVQVKPCRPELPEPGAEG